MAETLISPGVLARENDSSFVTAGPITAGAAIVGPTVSGPVGIPTVVTSYSQYQQKFGTTFTSGSLTSAQTYTYFTSIAAYNYFQNGGTSLLVTRVVNGAYTPATSSAIISASLATVPVFVLETLTEGAIANSTGSEDSTGALVNGTANNVRWQVLNPNTSSGTFDLVIRQGNDNTNNQTVLETYAGLTLDPFSPNYVARVIGDYKYTYQTDSGTGTAYLQLTGSFPNRSGYVRVKSVNLTTPNYFLNSGTPNPAFTGSLPLAASGSFGGAGGAVIAGANFYQNINSSNTQGLVAANYTSSLTLLANQDDYKYNVLLMPGVYNQDYTSTITTALTNTQNRGDAILVADLVAYGKLVSDVTGQAATRNSSYAASYWPWVQVNDPDSGQNVWVPASTVIGGVYAYNDSVSEPWFAPAGINRGGLSTVIRAERRLAQGDRDTLYNGKVNPIATFPGTGVVVYGQKTLQTQASALDRVNVRRLLIALKNYISQVAQNLVFEQNTAATRNNFLAQVNPYLESVQQRQGLYAFQVIMDDSNNTPTVIDQNQMVGQIYLQPTKTAEFIYLDFNITPTGATFPA
jgi:hypothetical protein